MKRKGLMFLEIIMSVYTVYKADTVNEIPNELKNK
jgi:hypothetical protein